MSTIRRRDLRARARPVSITGLRLLKSIRAGKQPPGYPREVIADSGIRADWAWSALLALEENGLIRRNDFGHVELTRAGRSRDLSRVA